MKTLLCALALGLSFNAHAKAADLVQWADFDEQSDVILKNDLKINDTFTLKAGTEFIVRSADAIDGLPVFYFSMRAVQCDAAMDVGTIDLTMLPDNINGFEYSNHCEAGFYVEASDYYTDSYFNAAPAR